MCPGKPVWMTNMPTNTKLSVKLQLGRATPKFIAYPPLQLIEAGVSTFPLIGGQTSSKSKAANCRGKQGTWQVVLGNRARKRWLSIMGSNPSFRASSHSECGKRCWLFWDSASESYLGLHWLRQFRGCIETLYPNHSLCLWGLTHGLFWTILYSSRFSSQTLGLLTAGIGKIHEDILQTSIYGFGPSLQGLPHCHISCSQRSIS